MATQNASLAKTRITTIQNKFIDGMIGDISPDPLGTVLYQGKTTDNSATELFINGKGGASSEGTTYYNRLYLPESTAVYFEYVLLTYNATDDTFPQFEKGMGFIQNLNGTTAAAFDLNKSGSGNEATVAFDVYTDTTASGIDLAQGSGAALTISADDTGDYIKVSVTGTSAKTIYYKVFLTCYSINEAECKYGFYFGDTAAQNKGI